MRHTTVARLGMVVAVVGCLMPASLRAASLVISTGKVLVLPFEALNPSEYQPWLGRSIQQSLAADLLAAAPGRVLSSDAAILDDAAAIHAARQLGAEYVIRGNFASVGGDVRITGQVLDADTGKPLTAIKATGPSSNVFAMEDELAAQIRRRLSLTAPVTNSTAPSSIETPPMNGVGVQVPAQPVDPYTQTYVAPIQGPSPPTQTDYNYYYGNPGSESAPVPFMGWPGTGWGFGVSYGVPGFGCGENWNYFRNNPDNRWNSSYALGNGNFLYGISAGWISTAGAPSIHNATGSAHSPSAMHVGAAHGGGVHAASTIARH
jgi:TolB-like protein